MEPNCVAYASNKSIVEFIEDQTEWQHKWDKSIMYYNIEWHKSLKLISNKQLRRVVNLAMTTWDIEIPIQFKPNDWWNTRKADIVIRFKTPDEDTYFAKSPSVLAYAYLPGQGSVSGQIVFNAAYIWDLKGKGIKGRRAKELGLVGNAIDSNTIRTYNIYHVLIHETFSNVTHLIVSIAPNTNTSIV